MKVKCIQSYGYLTKDKIYEVDINRSTNSYFYFLDKNISGGWLKSRFIIISDLDEKPETIKEVSPAKNQAEQCPCGIGITRAQCEYHK
jgi:hypothetical protein